jgi:hypothetical protein
MLVEICKRFVAASTRFDKATGESLSKKISKLSFGPHIDHDDMQQLMLLLHHSMIDGIAPRNILRALQLQQL